MFSKDPNSPGSSDETPGLWKDLEKLSLEKLETDYK
jgi:hypothetical protein